MPSWSHKLWLYIDIAMVANAKEESLLDLLSRSVQRPSLAGLNEPIFETGPSCKEVIEITGQTGSGKTYILIDVIAKCILPASFQERPVGGLECGVIFLDMDQRFDMFRLVRLMEVRVRQRMSAITDDQILEITSSSLSRLALMRIFDHDECLAALIAVRSHIFATPTVSLVLMDSIGAHYWNYVGKYGAKKMDSYVDDMLHFFQQYLGRFNITFMYTRPSHFQSPSSLPLELSTERNLKNVNTRIKLKVHNRTHRAEIYSGTSVHVVFYESSSNGIKWHK